MMIFKIIIFVRRVKLHTVCQTNVVSNDLWFQIAIGCPHELVPSTTRVYAKCLSTNVCERIFVALE